MTMLKRVGIVLSLIAALWLAGCAQVEVKKKPAPPKPPLVTPAEEAKKRLASAETAFAQRRFADAEKIFADYLRRFARQPGYRLALLRHGQCKLALDSPEAARRDFELYLRKFPDSGHAPEASLGLAEALIRLQRPLPALSALIGVPAKGLSEGQTVRYYDLTAQARFALNQPKTALSALVKGYASAPEEMKPVLIARLEKFIAYWPEETLVTLGGLYASPFPAAYLLNGLAQRALSDQNWTKALFYQKELIRRFPNHPLARRAGRERAWARLSESGVVTLGCLLPLTGPLAEYGQRLLEGMQLAAGVFDADSPFKLVIEDTADDPLVATAALERLALQEDALAIVGPLSGRLALAAAEKAQEIGVPLITLTQNPEVAKTGPWVMRNFITPRALIAALAKRAVADLKLRRVAVLYPETGYGRRMSELMADQVRSNGGEIVHSVSYPPDLADLADQLMLIGGQEPDDPPREEPLPFDALFIPDGYVQASQIAPQLAFYDLTPIALLGTNLWHDPELIKLAGPYVQGAIIPTSFFPESGEARVKDFVERFGKTYGRRPGLFAALGYDAMRLVVDVVTHQEIETRKDLLDALLKTKAYPGVTGLTEVNDQGEAVKKPYLVTVKGDKFVAAPTEPPPPPEESPPPGPPAEAPPEVKVDNW